MSETKRKKVVVKQVSGITLVAKGDSNHWVVMDGPETFGGSLAGSRPMELILMGLGGCTGMDVVSILQKKRVNLKDFKVEIEAETAPEHPKVYTKIWVKFLFYGKGIREEDVKRAIDLSKDKYCSVSAMLKPTVEIFYDYEIIEQE